MREALIDLRRSALCLHTETKALLNSLDGSVNHEHITRHIVDRAYDTARALKALMLLVK